MVKLLDEEKLINQTFVWRNRYGDLWLMKITDFITNKDIRYVEYSYRKPNEETTINSFNSAEFFYEEFKSFIQPYDENITYENVIYYREVVKEFWGEVVQNYTHIIRKLNKQDYEVIDEQMIEGDLQFNISTGETLFYGKVVANYKSEFFNDYHSMGYFKQTLLFGFIIPMLVEDNPIGALHQYL